MKSVFLSYASEQESEAGKVVAKLRAQGDRVFLASDSLQAGEPFDDRIQRAIETCDLFVFLISAESCTQGRYTLTELDIVKKRWPNPAGRVLPVLVPGREPESIDSYLCESVMMLRPLGNFAADVARAARAMLNEPASDSAPDPVGIGIVTWPPPVEYPWSLADRRDEFEFFRKVLSGQHGQRLMFLHGKSNSGKTTVLREFAAYARELKLPTAVVDCKGCPSVDKVFETLRLDLARDLPLEAFSTGAVRLHQLIADFQQLTSPVVLIFDTYQLASAKTRHWLEEMLFPRLELAPAVVVVVAGQKVPQHLKHSWRSLVECRELTAIRRVGDWRDYEKRTWDSGMVSEEELALLILVTEGAPDIMVNFLTTVVKERTTAAEQ